MIISKSVGKQDGNRPTVPVKCKRCGKAISKPSCAKIELCNKCGRE